jgi:hypothetical protein
MPASVDEAGPDAAVVDESRRAALPRRGRAPDGG